MLSRFSVLSEQLSQGHKPGKNEYMELLSLYSPENAALLAEKADRVRRKIYGQNVYIRGLIEISNICRNDCYYCGIRRSNGNVSRYRLEKADILSAAAIGYDLGFRTFVLQGGEDTFFTDCVLAGIVYSLKEQHPDAAVTLSLGERSRESYRCLFRAGADRYLLRHETADPRHYQKLHPHTLSLDNRIACLYALREIGFAVGCGFMVGSPYQTMESLSADLAFIASFRPEMCGIGPFIPHRDTPFAHFPAGSVSMTLYLLSLIRLICPHVLLPATTALSTLDPAGTEKGVLAGANVVMPNLSPRSVRSKYMLYNGKKSDGAEGFENLSLLSGRMKAIGFSVVIDRGDPK